MHDQDRRAAVRDFYADSAILDQYRALNEIGLTPFEEALLARVLTPGRRVLDVGCGAGREACVLIGRGMRVVAVDIVPEMVQLTVREAASRALPVAALVADTQCLPFRDESFESAILVNQVIAHVPGRDGRVAALRDIHRTLKPGGVLAMTTHNRRCPRYRAYFAWVNPWRRALRALGFAGVLDDDDRWSGRSGAIRVARRAYFHMYDLDEAVVDLTRAGFEITAAGGQTEFESGRSVPRARERDYLLGFVARKPVQPVK